MVKLGSHLPLLPPVASLFSGLYGANIDKNARLVDKGHTETRLSAKHILILTDTGKGVKEMASEIAGFYRRPPCPGGGIRIYCHRYLARAVDICFLGCSAPNSPALRSLSGSCRASIWLAAMGFTEDAPEAIAWLRKICNDSDLALSPEAMSYSDIKNLGEWAKKISSGK